MKAEGENEEAKSEVEIGVETLCQIKDSNKLASSK